MKLLILAALVLITSACSAQGFFKPLPKPGGFSTGHFSLATDSVSNSFRPVVGVTASILSDASTLAGGIGIGWQHNKWDVPSQAWVTEYSVSGLVFLGSNGSNADVIGGLAFGFLNFMSVGPGYDFTAKKFCILTGVQIHFN